MMSTKISQPNNTILSDTTVSKPSAANAMFTQLFQGQMAAMAKQLANKFGIDEEAALKLCNSHCATVDITKLSKRKKSSGPRKPKVPVTAANRCMSRVWGDGFGDDQCKSAKMTDSDYCKRCSKKAAVCDNPCQLDENGKRKGLFCGRVDQFEPGTTLPPFSCGTEVRIVWKGEDVRDAISTGFDGGSFTSYAHTAKKGKSKKKTTTTAKVISEDELASLVSSKAETKTSETKSVSNESETFQDVVNEFGLNSEDDEQVDAEYNLETHGPDDDDELEEGGETLELEQWEHADEEYLVERSSLLIYNEEAEIIGKWGQGATKGAPIPEE
jgi:hypothetical protein